MQWYLLLLSWPTISPFPSVLLNSFGMHESSYYLIVTFWYVDRVFSAHLSVILQLHLETARPVPGSQFWSGRLRLPPTNNIWCVSDTKPPCGVPFDPYMIIIVLNTFNCQSDILVHSYQLYLFLEDSHINKKSIVKVHLTCDRPLHMKHLWNSPSKTTKNLRGIHMDSDTSNHQISFKVTHNSDST